MAYFLGRERKEDVVASYHRYQQYLQELRHRFPPGAFVLGTAEWWHQTDDHRCPHDAWLESLEVKEPSEGTRHEQRRSAMTVRLLGAYHDGHIELHYPQVFSYQLHSSSCVHGLGDWLYDEFTLSPDGHVIHEIEWSGFGGEGTRWIIEASDLEFSWIPKDAV